MNPSSKRQAILLGLFTTVATLILAGAILMIGTLKNTFTSKIGVTAVFRGVEGLQPGDNIWFSGMKVGTVKDLHFTGVSEVEAELRIDESAVPYIHTDVQAKIGSDGLIGNRIVVLFGGSVDAPEIKEGDRIAVSETVSTEDIMATFQENNENLLAITSDLKALTAGIAAGEGSLGKLLKDDALFASVKDTAAKLNTASASAERLTASLATFSRDLNKEGSLPQQLLSDTTTYPKVQEAVGDLQAAGASTKALVEGLKAQTEDPNTALGAVIADEEVGADLRVTLDNLRESSRLLNEDLDALQHTWILRRALRKQRKAEAEGE